MSISVGVYAPKLHTGPQTAPLDCLRQLFDTVSSRSDVTVTHLCRSTPGNWDESMYVPKLPGQCERVINRGDFDVVHFNTFTDIVTPKLLSAPSVLTYHGDVHWELPGVTGSRLGDRARCALEATKIPQYTKVLTVSSDLGTRVRNRYGRFGTEPATLYNGVDFDRFQPTGPGAPDSYGIEQPYVLHVSSYTKKKNPAAILEAFEQLAETVDAELVICGGGWEESDTVSQLLDAMDHSQSVTLAGYVPDEELPGLYRDAAVFLYPSLHESFGLPIVEAMACGTPVVTADRYAPPEVAGGAAITCDPDSPAAIADGVRAILTDPQQASELRRRGLERAKSFTWAATADTLVDVYRAVMADDSGSVLREGA